MSTTPTACKSRGRRRVGRAPVHADELFKTPGERGRGGGHADAAAEHAQKVDEAACHGGRAFRRRLHRGVVVWGDVKAEACAVDRKASHHRDEAIGRAREHPGQRERREAAERHAGKHDEARIAFRDGSGERRDDPERDRNDHQPQPGRERGLGIAAHERKGHAEKHPVHHPIGHEHANGPGREGGRAQQAQMNEGRGSARLAPDEGRKKQRRGDQAPDERRRKPPGAPLRDCGEEGGKGGDEQ